MGLLKSICLVAGVLAVASFAPISTAAAQGEYSWSFIDLDGRAAANFAACTQCDDIELALFCSPGNDQITILPFIDVKQGEDMDFAKFELNIDQNRNFAIEGFLELNLMEDILQPVIEIKRDNPLLGALVAGSELTISVRGQDGTYSLKGAGQAIGAMLDICKG